MRNILLGLFILSFLQVQSQCVTLNGDSVFINEIHYDNAGTDANEGVELVGPAGTNLNNYRITLYEGGTGLQDGIFTVNALIPDEGDGYGAVWINTPGIGNGSPDGIALANISAGVNLVQFISYEGSFTAINGDAAGLQSEEINAQESEGSSSVQSIQLSNGAGFCPESFEWIGPVAQSQGMINSGQFFAEVEADELRITAEPLSCLNTGELFEITVCAVNSALGVIDVDYTTDFQLSFVNGSVANLSFISGSGTLSPVNGCATFVVGYTQIEDISFEVTSGVLVPDTTGMLEVSDACKRMDILSAIVNACGSDRENELITLKTQTASVEVGDIVFSVIDPANGVQPNVNYAWSSDGTENAGDGSNSPCGGIDLKCLDFLDVNTPGEETTIELLIADLNAQAGCALFEKPQAGGDHGIIPANSQAILFMGAGGSNIEAAGFDGLGTNMDFSGFCGGSFEPIYVIFGRSTFSDPGYVNNNERRLLQLFVDGQLVDELAIGTYGSAGSGNASAVDSGGDFFASTDCTPSFLFSETILDASSFVENDPNQPQILSEETLVVFPNPATSLLSVRYQGEEGNIFIRVSDLSGRTILSRQSTSASNVLDVSSLSSGIYLLDVQVEGERIYKRIFIQ
ncbi:MAG: T9SS type A sorting domain-containing protein [Bacteroidota bacterium]